MRMLASGLEQKNTQPIVKDLEKAGYTVLSIGNWVFHIVSDYFSLILSRLAVQISLQTFLKLHLRLTRTVFAQVSCPTIP